LRERLETIAPLEPATAAELVADGIVDRSLDVTARGRRALGLDTAAARPSASPVPALSVSIRGRLPARARVELAEMLGRVAAIASSTPVRARASLVRREDRALERPVEGTAQLELPRHVVRAHVAAASVAEAVTRLESQLRRNLVDLRERAQAARKERPPVPAPQRPPSLRRTSSSARPLTVADAVAELRSRGHAFHLFVDAGSGEDAVVYLRDDGMPACKRIGGDGGWIDGVYFDPEPAPRLDVERAVERLTATQEPFLFFVDAGTGRGAVLHRQGIVTLVSPER
jgi:hypothetical protein